jgi:hypothetical protein
MTKEETCAICGCGLHRVMNTYARPTVEGRSHATAHHYVAERFFGRSSNRRNTKRSSVFETCPWGAEGKKGTFCYECHEELLHNPVLLPDDVERFRELVQLAGLSEDRKSTSKTLMAGRIQLFQSIIARGIEELLTESRRKSESLGRPSTRF